MLKIGDMVQPLVKSPNLRFGKVIKVFKESPSIGRGYFVGHVEWYNNMCRVYTKGKYVLRKLKPYVPRGHPLTTQFK